MTIDKAAFLSAIKPNMIKMNGFDVGVAIRELLAPKPLNEDAERALFEADLAGTSAAGMTERDEKGNYEHRLINFMWFGWLACATHRSMRETLK